MTTSIGVFTDVLILPVSSQSAAAAPAQARKPRRLDYTVSDAPLVEEIIAGVKTGRWKSHWGGCIELSARAKGRATAFSKIQRLSERIKKLRRDSTQD